MKTMTIAVALSMALIAVAPLATASANDDGHLSRTFLTAGSINWEPHTTNPGDGIGGAGWYHPDQRDDLCFVRLFGFGLAAGVYYESARHASSDPSTTVATIPQTTVSGSPCPFDSTLPPGQVIGTSEAKVNLGSEVSQSALVCTKTFSLCAPDPNTASWVMYDCGTIQNVIFGKGDIIGVETLPNPINGIAPTIGASQLISGCANSPTDVSSYLSSQLDNLASLQDVPVSTVASGTTYVLSCFSIDYQVFPANEQRTGVSHDWFAAVDGSVTPAEVQHFVSGPSGAASGKYTTVTPNSVALQGFYDLSGNNGCPL